MATEIKVPTLGESVTEATIGKWFKKPGEVVRADEPLVELETDKVTLEVNAPAAGVLGEILAKTGETVGPGATLGTIAAGSGAAAAPATAAAPAPAAPAPAPAAPSAAAPVSPAAPPSPAAAKIAADRGLDPAQIEGSGRRGQVLKGDVLAAPAPSAAAAPAPAAAPVPAAPRVASPPADAA
ncbi:biotin/lipoyl-containing protein, partial [Labrys sp. WJW]|uniref:biotin/lipoyl-containing protein n=1 Tax=Labrys sp. WJW TaxID=1737983 RepID=UPI000B2C8A21